MGLGIKLYTRFKDLSLPEIELTSGPIVLLEALKATFSVGSSSNPSIHLNYQEISDNLQIEFMDATHLECKGPALLGKLKVGLRNAYIPYLISKGYGLLHGVLLEVNGTAFLLVGSSGSGKTTYGNYLKDKLGAKILANDYVVCHFEKDRVFASDINFASKLKHPDPVELSGFFVLSSEIKNFDIEIIDSKSVPNIFLEVLNNIEPDFPSHKDLRDFWTNLPNAPVFGVSTCRNSIEETGMLLARTITSFSKKTKIDIGVVGLGSVGTELAAHLIHKPYVDTVSIIDVDKKKQHGLALDFQHAALLSPSRPKICECSSIEDFWNTDILFICVRILPSNNDLSDMEERMQKAVAHVEFAKNCIQTLLHHGFKGKIIVISNPVEVLVHYFYKFGKDFPEVSLYTHQIFGSGLELDRSRALSVMDTSSFVYDDIWSFIQHGEHLALNVKNKLSSENVESLVVRTKESSSKVREYVPRTVYGPISSAIHTMEVLEGISQGPVCLSYVADDIVVGGPVEVNYGIPNYFLSKGLFDSNLSLLSSWKDYFKSCLLKIEKQLSRSA